MVGALLLVPACPELADLLDDLGKGGHGRHRRRSPMSISLDGHVRELLAQKVEPKGKLSIVFVLDGLRPDNVNATDTPNLFRLRQQGVNFVNGHAVFPTVTRVNSPSIATGYYPGPGRRGQQQHLRAPAGSAGRRQHR